MAFVRYDIVGGIESDSSEFGRNASTQACALGGPGLRARLVKQISANVAAWNSHPPNHHDHDVRIILADALAFAKRVIGGRIHAGCFGSVADFAWQS
jgi:hypothetical protein